MLPNFVLDETTIRESGESAVLDLLEQNNQGLLLTLGITHAVEQESVNVEILGSHDGFEWNQEPVLSFPRKFYCGTYEMRLPNNRFRFLKAVWTVNRWGRGDLRPFFRVYLQVQEVQAAQERTLAGAA